MKLSEPSTDEHALIDRIESEVVTVNVRGHRGRIVSVRSNSGAVQRFLVEHAHRSIVRRDVDPGINYSFLASSSSCWHLQFQPQHSRFPSALSAVLFLIVLCSN